MKKLTLKFDGMKDMLTKEQMRDVTGGYSSGSNMSLGGRGCCAHTAGWTQYQCGYPSAAQAQAAAASVASSSGQSCYWCCSSCP